MSEETNETQETTTVKRKIPTIEEFIDVVVVRRSEFPTRDKAAEALGLKRTSFDQRLKRELKEFGSIFEENGFTSYPVNRGRTSTTKKDVLAAFERIKAKNAKEQS